MKRELDQWRLNVGGDVLGGLVTTFSVIPEVICFTIVAGMDPIAGLYTSIVFLVLMSFLGGRPALVSAGAGSMAVVVVSLIRDHGTAYLFAAVLLAGAFQLVLGVLRIGNLMKYVPKPVLAGFVDALAIIIFRSQVSSYLSNMGTGHSGIAVTILLIAVGIAIVYIAPHFVQKILSTLIAIVCVTLLWLIIRAFGSGFEIAMISDLGNLTATLPDLALPAVPPNLETVRIIFPYAVSLAFVGLLETLLTAWVVDEMTESDSEKNRECRAQGIGNIVCGLIGAMPGCAMIGQAITNVRSGGRGRLSTFVAGCLLAVLLVFGSAILGVVPLAALIAVMATVAIATFDWRNLGDILFALRDLFSGTPNRAALQNAAVTLLTVVIVVATDNLAYGVAAGLILYGLFYLISRKSPPRNPETSAEHT